MQDSGKILSGNDREILIMFIIDSVTSKINFLAVANSARKYSRSPRIKEKVKLRICVRNCNF